MLEGTHGRHDGDTLVTQLSQPDEQCHSQMDSQMDSQTDSRAAGQPDGQQDSQKDSQTSQRALMFGVGDLDDLDDSESRVPRCPQGPGFRPYTGQAKPGPYVGSMRALGVA
ncbi:hypothetical protein BDN67DRAFT_986232 [Paxillus ammoniavirescens]|nr:hypothetical protein BDN67DRAFT_986232 [Paxillus ammoniavirescens]